MRRLDALPTAAGRPVTRRLATALAVAAGALSATAQAAAADEPLFRHRAPIVVEQHAAFLRLPLPAAAYARSLQPGLQDLRVVDALGARVPFALLAPRADEVPATETERPAPLYPLPPRPPGAGTTTGASWPLPVEVVVDGDRITVRRGAGAGAGAGGGGGGGDAAAGGATAGGSTPGPARAPSPGWLFDLGERGRGDPAPHSLRLQWSGPVEFSAAYTLELSDDLRRWRPAVGGQLMALASAAGPLTQPTVALPAAPGRFARLVWLDDRTAPQLSGAQSVATVPRRVSLEAPTELVVAPSAEPAAQGARDADAARALSFDLGAPLPLVSVELQLGGGTQVVPLRLQARQRAEQPWQPLGAALAYRIERDGAVVTSPPVPVARTARYLRVVVDERAAVPAEAQTRLRVQAQLAGLVFAAQGQPPYALLAGARDAPAGALPLAMLVPDAEAEATRYGRAQLGDWAEAEPAARAEQARERQAALRPWLLWGVIGLGVAGLGWMVWRLARGGPSRPAG